MIPVCAVKDEVVASMQNMVALPPCITTYKTLCKCQLLELDAGHVIWQQLTVHGCTTGVPPATHQSFQNHDFAASS